MRDDYENIVLTEEFWRSVASLVPPLSDDDVTGIADAIDYLDEHPTDLANRLHLLDRDLTGRWSLTPLPPADPCLRVLLHPESSRSGGYWRVEAVTWHYHK